MGISGEKKKTGRRNKHSEILVITVEEVWTGGRTVGTKQQGGVRESRLRVRKREAHTDGIKTLGRLKHRDPENLVRLCFGGQEKSEEKIKEKSRRGNTK